jgi:hypothetical protein
MKVKLGQAVKIFFGKSSLDMVYFEAIANSLDANATEITIDITGGALSKPDTFEIKISDNGEGFTNERYKKFSKLFDVDEGSHKGLGRLVYLCYFDKVSISSHFDSTKKRDFIFNDEFNEDNGKVIDVKKANSGTVIKMSNYTLSKLKQYSFVDAAWLKNRILEEFYSRFFKIQKEEKEIKININTNIENVEKSSVLELSDIPTFENIEFDSHISMFDKFQIFYSIQKVDPLDTSLIAAISVDDRTVNVEVIAKENVPLGYKMVFLLFSDWFNGKVDPSRQALTISDIELKGIQSIFRKQVSDLIELKLPFIKERNTKVANNLIDKFPHLSGFFDKTNIGYVSRNDILKKAQDQFFKEQKDVLEATSLTDEQYQKSIDLASRGLTEYVLFRQLTIDKLKNTSKDDNEGVLHKLFAPMSAQFNKENLVDDLYQNNAWLLDDKFMTYETVLSDKEMGNLIDYVTDEKTERDADRPDLAFVFSNNPDKKKPFDVVIVELKKRGISLEDNMRTITQLEKRARKLMTYYNNQIQRIWYYGIIEFNEEVELALSGEYTELYSSGKMYYRESTVAISKDPLIKLPIGVFMWDIDALIGDADSRNSAFLNLVKSKFIVE